MKTGSTKTRTLPILVLFSINKPWLVFGSQCYLHWSCPSWEMRIAQGLSPWCKNRGWEGSSITDIVEVGRKSGFDIYHEHVWDALINQFITYFFLQFASSMQVTYLFYFTYFYLFYFLDFTSHVLILFYLFIYGISTHKKKKKAEIYK